MELPELLRARVAQQLAAYCERKVPLRVRDQVRLAYEIAGTRALLVEERASLHGDTQWSRSPLAQFRFDSATLQWSLYCADRNGRWHLYRPAEPARDIGALLHAIDTDTTGIFFG